MDTSYKKTLFYHLNSYWIYRFWEIGAKPGQRFLQDTCLYQQISLFGEKELFSEGYQLGEAIYHHYQIRGTLSLPPKEMELERKYPHYTPYLNEKIHAWAVPLSYRNYTEQGLDKPLNLWGSTMAHRHYFRLLTDEVITYLRALPARRLPTGFVDIGCGDGSLLRTLQEKLGGRNFTYIGIDIDDRSHHIAKEAGHSDIIFLKGDVSDPDAINEQLLSLGLAGLDRYMHIRAFVDHNFSPVYDGQQTGKKRDYHYLGKTGLLEYTIVEDSYRFHFSAWKKYIHTYGIAMIELHRTENSSLESSPAIAYEIFHFLSSQYLLTYSQFVSLTRSAGWEHIKLVQKVPDENPTVSIGIYK